MKTPRPAADDRTGSRLAGKPSTGAADGILFDIEPLCTYRLSVGVTGVPGKAMASEKAAIATFRFLSAGGDPIEADFRKVRLARAQKHGLYAYVALDDRGQPEDVEFVAPAGATSVMISVGPWQARGGSWQPRELALATRPDTGDGSAAKGLPPRIFDVVGGRPYTLKLPITATDDGSSAEKAALATFVFRDAMGQELTVDARKAGLSPSAKHGPYAYLDAGEDAAVQFTAPADSRYVEVSAKPWQGRRLEFGDPALDEHDAVETQVYHRRLGPMALDVVPGHQYTLTVPLAPGEGDPTDSLDKAALVSFRFLDAEGNELAPDHRKVRLSRAAKHGLYAYLATTSDDTPSTIDFVVPGGCTSIEIAAKPWHLRAPVYGRPELTRGNSIMRTRRSRYAGQYVDADAGGTIAHRILADLASRLPQSNGSRYFDPIPLKAAIVADVYMFNFYRDCFREVVYVAPGMADTVAEEHRPDVFIFVTCWAGIDDQEWRGVTWRDEARDALDRILADCRARGIRTIFQSIEDPSNFDYFLETARKFDCVFTTDTDVIDRYREALGHDNVFFGEYGVNPLLNNPIGSRRPPINAAFFAGSFPARYPERCHDMQVILGSILESGEQLVIADRNYGMPHPDTDFPPEFLPHIIPAFDHALLQAVHKLFRHNLNFNSIKGSPTMCAMRIYELQAQGRSIISNYARSVLNRFPGIQIVPVGYDMRPFFGDDPQLSLDEYEHDTAAVRNVLDRRTANDIVRLMLANAGFELPAPRARTIAVIADELTEAVRLRFDAQAYPHKVLIDRATATDARLWQDVAARNAVAYLTVFSQTDDYEQHYLGDMVNAFKYTAARYVTKAARFEGGMLRDGPQHEFTNIMAGTSRSLFCADLFSLSQVLQLPQNEACLLDGGYAVDPFNLNHTDHLVRTRPTAPAAYDLSVIVPVYNNGRFLIDKCLASLKRNACWPRMEILLVDDGSTDGVTPDICRRLERVHPNVRTFFFGDGGSGSASRPRNKGIDMAAAPLISFLDPDNEISPGGYDTLLRIYATNVEEGLAPGFVSGFQAKVTETAITTGKHTQEDAVFVDDLPGKYFRRGRFPVVSSQASVIRRDLFDGGRLRFVEGAAGQDTLFGWELMQEARCGTFTGAACIVYYAQRADSVTNVVDLAYFRKKLKLETRQSQWLKENGILNEYNEHHFDEFFREWYLKKLALVRQDRGDCIDILRQILALYGRQAELPV